MSITSEDGAFTLEVPAGVSLASQPTITKVDASALPFSTADVPPLVGPAYEVGPDGATFSTPATVRMRLPADFSAGGVAVLASRSSTGTWELLADQSTQQGPDGSYLVGATNHLTLFVAVGDGILVVNPESVTGKVGDQLTVNLSVISSGDPPWFSIRAISATQIGPNLVAHLAGTAFPAAAVAGDGVVGALTIQCDVQGTTSIVVEWVVSVSAPLEGNRYVRTLEDYTIRTEIFVNCTAPPSACAAAPGGNTALIDFSTTVTGLFPDLGDATGFCESIAGFSEPDGLGDQFAQDTKPPGLASDANDMFTYLALGVPEGVSWTDGKSACGTTVGGADVDCGVMPFEDDVIAVLTFFETRGAQPADGLVSLGVNLIVDGDPSNNWPAQPVLPLQVLRGADAVITPQAIGDGTFAKPTYTDLRANTGRQSNAMVLIAPSWYAFVVFDSATQVLPWVCQFDNVGQGNEHQACDLPGSATAGQSFHYLTPSDVPLP